MFFVQIFQEYGLLVILSLAFFAFVAGFIDSVVGGGGLIQIPAMLISFPKMNIITLFGTNKIASLSGTAIAAYQYSKRVKFNYKLLLIVSLFSGLASFMGAKVVSHIHVDILKPVILVILIVIAIYTFRKKDMGLFQTKILVQRKQILFGSLIGLVVGFYDGFFGPGTGSFLVLGFVVILGFEFIEASAYSKVINCMTNFSALVVFIRQGNYITELAILMAVCNILGNILGTRLALRRGNKFVRIVFLIIVTLMIFRYSYDIFFKEV